MFDRNKTKRRARANLKEHYVFFVLACLLAAFLGVGYTSSLSGIEATKIFKGDSAIKINNNSSTAFGRITVDSVLSDLMSGKDEEASQKAERYVEERNANEIKIGNISSGNGKGALSSMINTIGSGTVLITICQTIITITKSKSIGTAIFVVLATCVYLGFFIFAKNTFTVAFKRIFLETYCYEKVKVNRFLFLFRVKKAHKAAWTIFVTNVYLILWSLTIVGGVIKRYSYFMVPYIMAENPDIDTKTAIKLSRDMMDGHKLDTFKLELSFIGWYILSAGTLGLLSIFFVNPYKECALTEYYVYVRSRAKKTNVVNSELLNDYYLFYKATQEQINEKYADIYEIMHDDIELKNCKHTGIRGFFENNFGVIWQYDEKEDLYNTAIEQEVKIRDFKYVLANQAYPGRFFPIPDKEKNPRLEHTHYLRHYSIFSIFALFFVFAFIGWSWEVLIHIVKDGVFINRGTLHGPWLPIYGSGGGLILLLLYRFRARPGRHLIATVVLCGTLEYFTHLWLWETRGMMWWDYSGYFLNIDGRICAEGLLAFALGGTAIVYLIAPIIDNQLRKINQKILMIVVIILIAIFSFDVVYSASHPNAGKGITDYGQVTYLMQDSNL